MRNTNAKIAGKIMKITGFRFSKSYRHGETLKHRIVYKLVNTVLANMIADGFI